MDKYAGSGGYPLDYISEAADREKATQSVVRLKCRAWFTRMEKEPTLEDDVYGIDRKAFAAGTAVRVIGTTEPCRIMRRNGKTVRYSIVAVDDFYHWINTEDLEEKTDDQTK